MGRWYETPTTGATGVWGYDEHGVEDIAPYPPVHVPSPAADVNPDHMPPEYEHRHGGAP